MNWNRALFPSLKRRGGCAIDEMDPFRNGAAGVARSASPIGRSLKRSSAKLFRPEQFAELTTLKASRYPRSRFAPVCGASVASQLLLMPQPPFLRRGIEPNSRFPEFVHTFYDRL